MMSVACPLLVPTSLSEFRQSYICSGELYVAKLGMMLGMKADRKQQSIEYMAGIVADLFPGASADFPTGFLGDDGLGWIDLMMAIVAGDDHCISVFHDRRMHMMRFTRLSQIVVDDNPRL